VRRDDGHTRPRGRPRATPLDTKRHSLCAATWSLRRLACVVPNWMFCVRSLPQPNGPANALDLPVSAHTHREGPGCRFKRRCPRPGSGLCADPRCQAAGKARPALALRAAFDQAQPGRHRRLSAWRSIASIRGRPRSPGPPARSGRRRRSWQADKDTAAAKAAASKPSRLVSITGRRTVCLGDMHLRLMGIAARVSQFLTIDLLSPRDLLLSQHLIQFRAAGTPNRVRSASVSFRVICALAIRASSVPETQTSQSVT
jgi:hypothetical protein